MKNRPEIYYSQELSVILDVLKKCKKQRNIFTAGRIITFLGAALLLYYFASREEILWLYGAIALVAGFILLNIGESRLLKKIRFYQEWRKGLETELSFLQGSWKELDEGNEFKNQQHPYSHDLDIFGADSLFQGINRTVTAHGKQELATLLLHPMKTGKQVKQRQEAVQELSGDPEWCHRFRAAGRSQELGKFSAGEVNRWMEQEVAISPQWKIFLYILPVISIGAWLLYILGAFSLYQIPLGISLTYLGIVFRYNSRINAIHAQLDHFLRAFSKMYELIRLFEEKKRDSQLLKEYYELLFEGKKSAGKAFSLLTRTLESFDQRGNMLAAVVLNGLYLKDLQLIFRLAHWKREYAESIPAWIRIIGDLDVLVSQAGYAFNHPGFTFPEVSDSTLLEGREIGHPLLARSFCVTNDFSIKQLHEFYIITGANMAGKSTFLRSVGVNMVLAHSGHPVFAQQFSFQPMAIFTSMRTVDNLARGTSYFHAELLRLKQLVETAEQEQKTFIILDEILKGTNSVDKLNGSIRFLQKLRRLPIAGLVATHDLELGKLEEKFPENYINSCFEITHTDDDIAYDYKLKPGVSRNMNASILLEKMELV